MKLTFLVLALAIACALNTPQQAHANVAPVTSPSVALKNLFGGPEVPFPLSAQVDFPWANIEGVWLAKGKNLNTEFSFHIQSNGVNGPILQVLQVNADGAGVIATGTGVSINDDTRTVRALMIGAANAQTYFLIIRAFKNEKTGKIETVLTIRGVSGDNDDSTHFVVRKLASDPLADLLSRSECSN